MDTLTSRFTNCSDNEGIGFYYTYNGKGKLVRIEVKSVTITDGAVTGGTLLSSENYLYDGSDRLIRVVETDGDNVVLHDFSWTYDAKDNVTALTESIGGKSFSYTYAYDDDSRPTTFGYGDVTKQITYDGHGRSSGTTVKNGSRTVLGTGYAYRDVDSTYTTTQVKSVTNSYGGKTANFNYTYDANGNILSVSGAQAVTYEYDDLGQLVWEKNATAGKAWNYTYDNGGNILSRTEYTCSSSGTVSGSGTTTSYTYGDAEWGDLLTAYNGEEITYDGIGNPLSYRGWTMNWQGGRQLASMTKGSDTLNFVYNESGLRTSKTVNGVTHSYVWQGSKLAADITDAYALYFHYDSSGEVIGFTRTANGTDTEYFYVKNLQGDILKVITATGTEAAAYTYDAWGKLLTSTGDMAEMNPIRYRGYYYDTETGLYYLQSRYYNPEVGRFINSDAYATTNITNLLASNAFLYCYNCPTCYADDSGEDPFGRLNIIDYAFIHRMVQLKCQKDYGWSMEVGVKYIDLNGKFRRGRLDLYDELTNQYYEVKSIGASLLRSTARQMNNYDISTITRNQLTPGRGTGWFCGSFEYGMYDVYYESTGCGLIVYVPTINDELRNKAILTAAAVAVGAALIASGVGAGAVVVVMAIA